jgi:phage portal protein BeeE
VFVGTVGTAGKHHKPRKINMPLFGKKETKAQISLEAPKVEKAAAAGSWSGQNSIGQYFAYDQGTLRNAAMRIPAVSRARDLHASVVSAMPLRMYREVWNEANREMDVEYLAPRSWLRRPDPAITYEALMSWTIDDLLFTGRAFWFITSRTADGFPASFTRMPAAMVSTPDQAGPVFFAPSNEIEFSGMNIDPANVVQFIGGTQGIIYMSQQTIATALKIEESRYRNAETAIPSGILMQTGGEPLSAEELSDLAAAFNQARRTNQTAALNEFLKYEPTTASPDKQLMIESANYSALDISRLCNVPNYLLGVSTGSYAYTSSREARIDLWTFGTKVYAEVIAATLSSNQVLPNGTYVEFDFDAFLGEAELAPGFDREPQTEIVEEL